MAVGIPVAVGQNSNSSSSSTIVISGAVNTGDSLIIVVVFNSLTGTLTSITDPTYGNVFTFTGPFDSSPWRIYVAICNPVTRYIPANTNLTMTSSASGFSKITRHIRIPKGTTGIKVASPIDVTTAVSAGTGTAVSSPSSGVLSQADELLLAVAVQAGTVIGDRLTFNAPFTVIGTEFQISGIYVSVGYNLVSSTAAQAVSATLTNSKAWACFLQALKAGPLTGDTRRFAQEILERDISGITRQVTNIELEADVQGLRRSVSNVRLEVDFLQSAINLASLELEADTRGKTPSLAQVILEADFSENSRKGRVRPKIIG